MTTLTIGRVGLDAELWEPEQISDSPDAVELEGQLGSTTLEGAQSLSDELLATQRAGLAVPVTFSEDPRLDGFYLVADVGVETRAANVTSMWFPFTVTLRRIGNQAEIEFESRMTGASLLNDHSAGAAAFHAPPRGHVAYDPGATLPTSLSRTGSGGAITTYLDVDRASNPRWSVAPGDFYDGAVTFKSGDTQRLRAGLSTPNMPQDWTLENELLKVTPNATGGRIDVQPHDGTQWETAKTWKVLVGGSDAGAWDFVTLVRNDAAEVILRLVRAVSGGGRYTLDLSLRRGSRFVSGYLTAFTSSTLKVVRASTDAGSSITAAVRDASNDSDGNRYVIGSTAGFTADTTEGGLSLADTTTLDFFIGAEIGGSGATSGDAATDMVEQYIGYVSEAMRPVIR